MRDLSPVFFIMIVRILRFPVLHVLCRKRGCSSASKDFPVQIPGCHELAGSMDLEVHLAVVGRRSATLTSINTAYVYFEAVSGPLDK